MRFPFGAGGMIGAAALVGGVVYWRATSRRRAERLEAAVDDAIAEGRRVAETMGDDEDVSAASRFEPE